MNSDAERAGPPLTPDVRLGDDAESIEEVAEEVAEILGNAPSGVLRAEALLWAAQQDHETIGALIAKVTQVEPYTDADDLAKLRSGSPEIYEEIVSDMQAARELRMLETRARVDLAIKEQAEQATTTSVVVQADNISRRRGQTFAALFAGGCVVVAAIGAGFDNAAVVGAALGASALGGIGALAASWRRSS